MKISIIGVGAYSMGIAFKLASNNNNSIYMWTEDNNKVLEYNKYHTINNITNKDIPNNIYISNKYEEVLSNSELIFIITSSKYVRSVCNNILPYYKNIPICIASKGIENDTCNLLSNVVKKVLHTKNISVISGPTFAIDLMNDEPCGLAIAGNKKNIKLVKSVLTTDTLKLRESSDILGIQICGSIKNIIAISSGILSGLGYSESTRALLINESMHDIKNIIYYLGGKKKTILTFAGIGDLLLTCTSTKSRNYSFGYVIGSTKNKKDIKEYLDNHTVEGYYTLISLYKLLNKLGINMELINIIYDIVVNYEDPNKLSKYLILRN